MDKARKVSGAKQKHLEEHLENNYINWQQVRDMTGCKKEDFRETLPSSLDQSSFKTDWYKLKTCPAVNSETMDAVTSGLQKRETVLLDISIQLKILHLWLSLEQHMLPSRRLLQGKPWIFQQDDAKAHAASITTAWLQSRRVQGLNWSFPRIGQHSSAKTPETPQLYR